MKPTLFILIIMLSFSAKAQIAIGKDHVDGSALLDFEDDGNTRGIILPAVTTLPAEVNGTFVFDTADRKVKVYENGTWKELSEAGNLNQLNMDHLNAASEDGEGTIIGNPSSSVEGVLVLESTDKAMVLPKVASPHLNVASPYPGMMCYDTVTKSLAVFDGTKWYYWK